MSLSVSNNLQFGSIIGNIVRKVSGRSLSSITPKDTDKFTSTLQLVSTTPAPQVIGTGLVLGGESTKPAIHIKGVPVQYGQRHEEYVQQAQRVITNLASALKNRKENVKVFSSEVIQGINEKPSDRGMGDITFKSPILGNSNKNVFTIPLDGKSNPIYTIHSEDGRKRLKLTLTAFNYGQPEKFGIEYQTPDFAVEFPTQLIGNKLAGNSFQQKYFDSALPFFQGLVKLAIKNYNEKKQVEFQEAKRTTEQFARIGKAKRSFRKYVKDSIGFPKRKIVTAKLRGPSQLSSKPTTLQLENKN